MNTIQFYAVIAIAALLCGCSEEKKEVKSWQGYVEGEYVYVASPDAGQLKTLSVKRGDLVSEGAQLFSLDSQPESSELAQAEALLVQGKATLDDMRKGKRPEEIAALDEVSRQAKAAKELSDIEFKRETLLIQANAAAVKDYDSINYERMANIAKLAETSANLAVARLGSREDQIRAYEAYCESLKANCDALRWRLSQKSQLAPKGGRVFDTFYREGEYVAAEKAVVALLPPENINIRVFVGEKELASFKPGDKLKYKFDNGPGRAATVNYISPEVEFTPPVIYSRESRSKLVYMIEAVPSVDAAKTLNVGAPLDVEKD